MFDIDDEELIKKLLVSIILALILNIFLYPYFKMKAFNEFCSETGKKATYFDAMLGDLRIYPK